MYNMKWPWIDNTSPTIDALSWHMMHRRMVMLYDTSHTIDAWSCHMIHHLPSMHGHVIWYITYHRCMVMYILLYLHTDVSTYCCIYILLYLHTAVSTNCCIYILLYLHTAVSTYYCICILLYLITNFSTKLFHFLSSPFHLGPIFLVIWNFLI